MSDVQHLAEAPVPLSGSAGLKGSVHLSASEVSRMLVVVWRSHCEWRHTSSPSLVTATSHSMMPAPVAAAATYDSAVCSGNCMHAPRWPMLKVCCSKKDGGCLRHCSRSCLIVEDERMVATRNSGRGPCGIITNSLWRASRPHIRDYAVNQRGAAEAIPRHGGAAEAIPSSCGAAEAIPRRVVATPPGEAGTGGARTRVANPLRVRKSPPLATICPRARDVRRAAGMKLHSLEHRGVWRDSAVGDGDTANLGVCHAPSSHG